MKAVFFYKEIYYLSKVVPTSVWVKFCKITVEINILARGSVVGSGAMLQGGRSRVQVPKRSLDFFSIDLILLAALWPWSRLSL
jgi:hypothetical protein